MRPFRRRSTPVGQHLPVMPAEILDVLALQPGGTVVDCTLGFAGHAVELLRAVGPAGRLVACDLDAGNLSAAQAKLEAVGGTFTLHHTNFAGLANVLGELSLESVDGVLADLGMSSMQVDDAERGFSYLRDGPLDMRMDASRGRTAGDLLATLPHAELAAAFRDLGDEPQAERIASAIVASRKTGVPQRTTALAALVQEAAPVKVVSGPGQATPRQQRLRPVARVFQALRILVNRELASLQQLLRTLPSGLKPGGRAAIISFHSGEDRLVKSAFREGLRAGVWSAISDEPVRASFAERGANPRSRSAKLRWAVRSPDGR